MSKPQPQPQPVFDYIRLDKLIQARGVSEYDLADTLGISQPSVSRYRRGESTPRAETLILLSNWSGIDPRAWMTSDQ